MKSQINFNWKSHTLFIVIITLFILNSCGSDGGGSNSNVSEITGTISGNVSGTTILAIDDAGMIVASDNTKRRSPDLDRDGDGINESYSFTIIEVPVDTNIRIYLVESEGVSPMYFDDNGTNVNVFSLSSATEIDLGFIDSVEGNAIPEYNPTKTPNVHSEGTDDEMKTISQALANDFDGTWRGDVFYSMDNGESGTATVEIILSAKGNSLDGTFHFFEDNGERVEDWTVTISSTPVTGGACSFIMPKPPRQPWHHDDHYCDDWDVEFTAILSNNLIEMDIQFDDSFCGGTKGTFNDYISKQP